MQINLQLNCTQRTMDRNIIIIQLTIVVLTNGVTMGKSCKLCKTMDLDWIAFYVPIKLWNPAYNDNLKNRYAIKNCIVLKTK